MAKKLDEKNLEETNGGYWNKTYYKYRVQLFVAEKLPITDAWETGLCTNLNEAKQKRDAKINEWFYGYRDANFCDWTLFIDGKSEETGRTYKNVQ